MISFREIISQVAQIAVARVHPVLYRIGGKMSISEIAVVISVITAFSAPYVVFLLRRKYLAPKLEASYIHEPPMCRRSSRHFEEAPNLKEPFFDFHFQVVNEGRSPARQVEAVIEEIWFHDASGMPKKQEDFFPVNLRFDPDNPRFTVITPKRPILWNIGSIPSKFIQERLDDDAINDAPGAKGEGFRFILDIYRSPHFQTNAFKPGAYGIKVSLYSENDVRAEILLR